MYSSPIVVFAASSWLSEVPTATRIVPCATAPEAQVAARAIAHRIRRMLRAPISPTDTTHSVCSLPPCGGGLGRGVARLGAASPHCTTPTPDPSPQGGGESTELAARTDSISSENALVFALRV